MRGGDGTEIIRRKPWGLRDAYSLLFGVCGAGYFALETHRSHHPWYAPFLAALFAVLSFSSLREAVSKTDWDEQVEAEALKLTLEGIQVRGDSYRWNDVVEVGVSWSHWGSLWPIFSQRRVFLILREDAGYDDDLVLLTEEAENFDLGAMGLAELICRRIAESTGRQLKIQLGPPQIVDPRISKAVYYVFGMAAPLCRFLLLVLCLGGYLIIAR